MLNVYYSCTQLKITKIINQLITKQLTNGGILFRRSLLLLRLYANTEKKDTKKLVKKTKKFRNLSLKSLRIKNSAFFKWKMSLRIFQKH
jgi:hypothetical protein